MVNSATKMLVCNRPKVEMTRSLFPFGVKQKKKPCHRKALMIRRMKIFNKSTDVRE
jgi:hypothetical protein